MNGMFRAASEVVYMRKVGVRDKNHPLTKFYVRWVRFCGSIVAWHRPTLALSQEVDFPSETGMRSTPAGAQRRELSKSVEFL